MTTNREYTDALPVTPSDTVDLVPIGCRALLISVGGDLKITTKNGQTRVLTVPACKLNLPVTRVWATGTTATGISAWYS